MYGYFRRRLHVNHFWEKRKVARCPFYFTHSKLRIWGGGGGGGGEVVGGFGEDHLVFRGNGEGGSVVANRVQRGPQ